MENSKLLKSLMGILIVPVGLAIALAPYSILIGWNITTGFIFWFVLAPSLAIYLPNIVSKERNHLLESLVGLTIFYVTIMVMIYSHFNTDFFKMMAISFFINIILVLIFILTKKIKEEPLLTYEV